MPLASSLQEMSNSAQHASKRVAKSIRRGSMKSNPLGVRGYRLRDKEPLPEKCGGAAMIKIYSNPVDLSKKKNVDAYLRTLDLNPTKS